MGNAQEYLSYDEMNENELEEILGKHNKWDGADLRGSDLIGANLRGANLRGVDLIGSDLSGSDLIGANLIGANLSDADLSGADLRGSDLRDADLRDANLRGANLRGADLSDVDLRGADLRGADFRGARGITYAQAAFAKHGECGRQLMAVIVDDKIEYFCGCFRGSEHELRKYINEGDDKHKESRMLAFDFVTSAVAFGSEHAVSN